MKMTQGRDSDFGFAWSRTQFPIKPVFACTINKAQGSTVNRLGLLLDNQKRAPGRIKI
jgi:ATP-dependent exoDNAse (exonuclease V) alpha subunit